mmetsp:Transcript_99566/g.171402  ORF Transcript_99566/g.171402 Transcript_99566/m.171402 type:complete len:283 (+) Transcript_99566:2296-3144(+)
MLVLKLLDVVGTPSTLLPQIFVSVCEFEAPLEISCKPHPGSAVVGQCPDVENWGQATRQLVLGIRQICQLVLQLVIQRLNRDVLHLHLKLVLISPPVVILVILLDFLHVCELRIHLLPFGDRNVRVSIPIPILLKRGGVQPVLLEAELDVVRVGFGSTDAAQFVGIQLLKALLKGADDLQRFVPNKVIFVHEADDLDVWNVQLGFGPVQLDTAALHVIGILVGGLRMGTHILDCVAHFYFQPWIFNISSLKPASRQGLQVTETHAGQHKRSRGGLDQRVSQQ